MGEVSIEININDLRPEDISIEEIDLDLLTETELEVLERKIASKYMHVVPWGAIVWAFTNLAVWLSLWPLVFMDLIPLWLAFPIATLNVMLSYLPSHEAQHSIIAREGRSLRWLNELVGHLSVIPLALPFRVLRHTHFEHHNHANDTELDPDYGVHAKSGWGFLFKSILGRQPGSDKSTFNAYPRTLERVGKSHLMIDSLAYNAIYYTLLFAAALSGYALEAALLWWLPKQIAITYIQYYLSWAPHHPAKEKGRYKDTRGFKSKIGNVLSMGMQFHVIHHLYPRIPLGLTPAAFRELKPILVKKGVDIGEL
ncbi:MAG: beta-carotene hydroxylase [Candidatus Azotimanducaceae bacterium]|jgi:beta-carotene hydroxylase